MVFPSQNAEPQLFPFPSGFGQFALGVFDDRFDFGAGLGAEDNRDAENRRDRENASPQRQPRGHHGSRRQAGRHEGVPTLEGYIFCLGTHFGLLLLHLHHSFISFCQNYTTTCEWNNCPYCNAQHRCWILVSDGKGAKYKYEASPTLIEF